jgi:hypothetical protein
MTKIITSIENGDRLIFLVVSGNDGLRRAADIPIDELLRDDNAITRAGLPKELSHGSNILMVVPDFWIGNDTYLFQSGKESVIDAFIERKLRNVHQESRYYYSYHRFQDEENRSWLYVYYLQEEKSFLVLNRLIEMGLCPLRITSPAYIWQETLKEGVPGFESGGKGLVDLQSSECSLYFYFRGLFVFSRKLSLPDIPLQRDEKHTILGHEIDQSCYLFSQKAKCEIGELYLADSAGGHGAALSARMGDKIRPLPLLETGIPDDSSKSELPEPLGRLDIWNLLASKGLMTLTHRLFKREREWKPIQEAGIFIGFLLLIFLCIEMIVIRNWQSSDMIHAGEYNGFEGKSSTRVLREYSDVLDMLIAEKQRPSPETAIAEIMKLLPESVALEELVVDLESDPVLHFAGRIDAPDYDRFRASLGTFLSNLHIRFPGSRSIGMDDIDFQMSRDAVDLQRKIYRISFRFSLL